MTQPPEPVRTGDPAIDEALERLDALDDAEVHQHPAAFEHVHRVLRDALSGAGRSSQGGE